MNTTSDKTIIYYSDNRLDKDIEKLCADRLVIAAEGKPIISVTQKPMSLGTNICVGEIGSSWLNLYRQLQKGLEAATTQYVAMAEADCLYTPEHYNWTPPKEDVYFYNENCWFVQWGGNHPELNGMYSTFWYKDRKALSQLICNREMLLRSVAERLNLLDKEKWATKQLLFAGEPGVTRVKDAQYWAASGRGVSLMEYIKDFLNKETAETFETKLPNLDIRHSKNFTGPKRGKNRTYDLPYWGEFKNIIKK